MSKGDALLILSIGDLVRAARKAEGLRQADLAELAALPTSHISDIERGATTPTIPTLRRLGQALNRPLEYFLQDSSRGPRSLGMVVQPTSIGGQAATYFASLVEAKTGGEVRLRLYHHSALGTALEQVEALIEGAVPMYVDELHTLESYAPWCGAVCLPFFFRDRAHYNRFLSSEYFRVHIQDILRETGIHLLNPVSNWECGSFEILFSRQPIFSPDDLVGCKIRSYPSPAAAALRRALGAEPVMVEWAQVCPAFQQGAIDAFLAPAAYFLATRFQQFARYATLVRYGYTLNLTVIFSENAHLKLPPDIQQALEEAVVEAGEFCTQLAHEQAERDLARLSGEFGVPVIVPDERTWRARFDQAIQQVCEGGLLPPGMYRQLQEL
jgi:TRAP-type C4-dicarboxylate transport system substrate-binding protein